MSTEGEQGLGRQLRELKEAKTRYDLAVRATTDGIWDWNILTGEEYFSPRWCEILGYERSDPELVPTYEFWASRIHVDDRERIEAAVRAHLETGVMYDVDYRHRHRSGEYRWQNSRGQAVFKAGKPVRMVGAIRDITSLREAQTKRVDLEARLLAERNNALLASRLQHAQRMESLGLLAGGIAHDFNNLLVGVLGYADLALNELGPTSPARPLIEEARKSGERAADLCNQMLAYSGRGKFLVENIDLNDIVEDIRQLLEMVISKKVALQHKCSSGIPSISADETQIRQVIMNLVINASEAIGDESGVIAIATGAMECDRAYLDLAYVPAADAKEGNYIYVEVSDTGCGLDAAALDRIFDPFFTTKMTGRGLGLAAVLGIIRSHGGAIKVCSEPGAGTTIKVLFPAIDEPAPNRPTRTGSHEKWRGDGTILLVDDDETVLKIARIMLEEAGFRVRTAANGLEGLEVFAAHTEEITCVVLDLMMPQMDGSEAFREMRRLRPNVRVVLSSGYSDYDVTARFAGQGLAGFLKKPYRSSQLLEVVLAAIDA